MAVLAVSFFVNLLAVVFVICGLALMLIILAQKGKGGGLSSAFGGGLASGILGSKTGDFLTWVTIALASVFLAFAVIMAKFYKPGISSFDAGQPQTTEQPAERFPNQPSPTQQEKPSVQEETGEANSLNK
jgi:preprotein translocase subunit SecG